MPRFEDKRSWFENAKKIVYNYSLKNYGLEHLTLTQKTESKIDLLKLLLMLEDRLSYNSKLGIHNIKINWSGVIVNNQHLHILIHKPFVPYFKMKIFWEQILNYEVSGMYIKTLDYQKPKLIENTLIYIMNQGEHHNTENLKFLCSDNWGTIVNAKKKEEPKKSRSMMTDYLKTHKKEESYIIGKEFVTKEEFDKYMLTQPMRKETEFKLEKQTK